MLSISIAYCIIFMILCECCFIFVWFLLVFVFLFFFIFFISRALLSTFYTQLIHHYSSFSFAQSFLNLVTTAQTWLDRRIFWDFNILKRSHQNFVFMISSEFFRCCSGFIFNLFTLKFNIW